MKNNDSIWSQFCTCHDNTAVVTCAKIVTRLDHLDSKLKQGEFSQDFNYELKDGFPDG